MSFPLKITGFVAPLIGLFNLLSMKNVSGNIANKISETKGVMYYQVGQRANTTDEELQRIIIRSRLKFELMKQIQRIIYYENYPNP
jgi:hypothetical protein